MKIFLLTLISLFSSCDQQVNPTSQEVSTEVVKADPQPGAHDLSTYLPKLSGKKVGLVVNHTSMIDDTHLVDRLMSEGVDVQMIFAPEHGFKGTAYNGEEIKDGLYKGKTPIRSLYGKTKKPSSEDIDVLDVVVFDIQDVGARFYTYISTLHYVMEAAAEGGKEVIILDRPNPNGHYVDGPVLEEGFTSFVGMHPVPVVYGMTIGEYGQMINGEGWMKDGIKCQLEVVKITGDYTHSTPYTLPIAPSPNLPNQRSILLYPSLCFFEGTVISAGRGTNQQFQIYGHPDMDGAYTFTPVSMTSSKYPKHEGKLCQGHDLRALTTEDIFNQKELDLTHLINAYKTTSLSKDPFFLKNNFFNKLSGNSTLMSQVKDQLSINQIKDSWQSGLQDFMGVRAKYLLYPE